MLLIILASLSIPLFSEEAMFISFFITPPTKAEVITPPLALTRIDEAPSTAQLMNEQVFVAAEAVKERNIYID